MMSAKTNFNEDPSNTRSHPDNCRKRPKELIRSMKYRVNGKLMRTNISAKNYSDKIASIIPSLESSGRGRSLSGAAHSHIFVL